MVVLYMLCRKVQSSRGHKTVNSSVQWEHKSAVSSILVLKIKDGGHICAPLIPLASVNEDQLWLGRKRQVWFIPLADERRVCRKNNEIP